MRTLEKGMEEEGKEIQRARALPGTEMDIIQMGVGVNQRHLKKMFEVFERLNWI